MGNLQSLLLFNAIVLDKYSTTASVFLGQSEFLIQCSFPSVRISPNLRILVHLLSILLYLHQKLEIPQEMPFLYKSN